MQAVRVESPGMLTTVQDLGRWGLQAYGVPVAGPMDAVSFRLANLLAGNDERAAALEATVVGPELVFEADSVVAVAGGDLSPALDGAAVPMHTRFEVRAGQRLHFGTRREGARAYIAVEHGFDLPAVFGSRATHVLSGMGGLQGRALRRGDRLPIGAASVAPPLRTARDALAPPEGRPFDIPAGEAIVRVLGGPHVDAFSPGAHAVLYGSTFTLASESNRMGYRLDGPPLALTGSADLISEPVPMGALQVPASGQPILLMADHQTSGGYPIIGTVISADLPIAGQLAPGDRIRFAPCDPDTAQAALIAQERWWHGVR